MDESIEKIMDIAGKKNKYPILIVTITFFCWFCFELLSVSLSFLEMMPFVSYTNSSGSKVEERLNYDICQGKNYTIINYTNHSWVTEFGTECNKNETGLIGTFVFFGVMLGALIFQIIAEKLGRRFAILIAGVGFCCCMLVAQFAKYEYSIYYIYVLSVFLQIFSSIGNLGSYLLMNEVTSVDTRSVCGALVQSAFSFSGTLFILLYYYINSWRIPFIIAGLIALTNLILYSLLGFESPRYYLNKNMIHEFFLTLSKMSKFNGKEEEFDEFVIKNYNIIFPQNKIESDNLDIQTTPHVNLLMNNQDYESKSSEMKQIIEKIKEQSEKKLENQKFNSGPQYSCLSLLSYKSQRLNFLIMCYMWFCTSGVYYGLTINIKNLPGNTYITGIIMFFVEALAYMLSGFLINIAFLGRKKTIFMFYCVSAIVYGVIIIFKINNYWLTVLALLARFCVSGVYNIIYTYSTEVYPTVVRSNGLGFNSVCGRVGGMLMPYLLEILSGSITYLFFGLNLLALVAVMILPETFGKTLADSIPEETSKVNQTEDVLN